MDLQLYSRVLWRFRVIMAFGLFLAIALSGLSFARISLADGIHLEYRQAEEWLSPATLLVTQHGFPEGRTVTPTTPEGGASFGDANRFAFLAALYADLVATDPVRALFPDGPIPRGRVVASATTTDDGLSLPLIRVEAVANSRSDAIKLAALQSDAFIRFIDREQRANDVPLTDRVRVEIVEQPRRAEIFTPRSKALPIVVFLSVLTATFGLVFVLDNMRPPVRELREAPPRETRNAA